MKFLKCRIERGPSNPTTKQLVSARHSFGGRGNEVGGGLKTASYDEGRTSLKEQELVRSSPRGRATRNAEHCAKRNREQAREREDSVAFNAAGKHAHKRTKHSKHFWRNL